MATFTRGEIAAHRLTDRNGYVCDGLIPCRVLAVTPTGIEVQYAAGNTGKVGVGLMRKAEDWMRDSFFRMESQMNDFLHEWKNVTLGVMSRDLPTVIEALEGSVVRAETKANVVDFREAADWYHGDNPDYQLARLRRIRQYLRDERIWEADRQRWLSLTMAEGIVLGVIQRNFGEDE